MRRKDREILDLEQLTKILEECKVMHLGINDEPYPYELWLSL
jgi:nitroimidazol reductase NimA-like FMN-containing flavoprotein (pyridoxamine 5'-phosphate oxidase superfamily)